MSYLAGDYDLAILGAGHAGIEAARAGARLGRKVLLLAMQLDSVGNLPCNPAIGGTSKGHLVREIDALGGEMARAADACCIQYRMLNRGKGPAVHSLRAQADRQEYQRYMKRLLEKTPGLSLKQAEAVEITPEAGGFLVKTHLDSVYRARTVVLACGTYLRGRVIVGSSIRDGGPDGLMPAAGLTDSLRALGLPLMRFKTGTPPRINALTVDFSKMEIQPGEPDTPPFSFETAERLPDRAVCYMTHTTPDTHEIIRQNIHLAPMYSGVIEGVGPRYCPSIEDKVVRFADKERHHLFIEPMGLFTNELYVQGLSSSFPEEIQTLILHSIPGLERAEMTRPAYAIEYDCLDPLCLDASLMVKALPGLFGAGQINGSSGYEEAAAQGLLAGINAARFVAGQPPVTLTRDSSYIGVLVDDLVTKGTREPYRMMTSRSEYRLLLRQDNADERLTPLGYAVGLVSEVRFRATQEKYAAVAAEITRLEHTVVPPGAAAAAFLESRGSAPIITGARISDLVRRPELGYDCLADFDPDRPPLSPAIREQVEIRLRYEGYLKRQESAIARFQKMETTLLPEELDYTALQGLRIEARLALAKVRPASLGQASRIPGVNPADVTALMVALEKRSPGAQAK